MTNPRSVWKDALVFGTAPALQKLAALLLLPYFTHFLSPEQYGRIELVVFWTGLFVVVCGLEYRAGFLWRMASARHRDDRRRIVSASTWFAAALAGFAATAFWLAAPSLLAGSGAGAPSAGSVSVLAWLIGVDLFGVVTMAVLQAERRASRVVLLGLAQFVVDALLKIWLVAWRGEGVEGFFLASAVASSAIALASLFSVRDLLVVRIGGATMRAECGAILRYSTPLLWGALAYLLVRKIDRPLLAETLSIAALGVYGRTARLAQLVLDFYVLPFQRSFDVWRLEVHARGLPLAEVARAYRWFMLGAGLVATGVATFGVDLFCGLADADYLAVREQLPLLNVAMLCQCGATVAASAFFVMQKTAAWTRIFVVGLAIEVAMLLLLAPPLGIPGVALALTAAHGFLWWAASWFGKRLWPVPYDHGTAVLVAAVASGLSFARTRLPAGPLWLALCIDTGLLLGYAAVASWCARVRVVEWSTPLARWRDRILRR